MAAEGSLASGIYSSSLKASRGMRELPLTVHLNWQSFVVIQVWRSYRTRS